MSDTEKIIDELYALDPSLREQGDDVRALVTALLSHKPVVAVDREFLTNLRRSLIAEADRRAEHSYTSISWWMVRLVPLGAVAILTLTLLPTRPFFPTDVPVAPRGGTGGDAPQMETSSDASFKAVGIPSMVVTEEAQAPEPIIFSAVTVDTPSFVVVHVSVDGVFGEIVGVSDLLPAGRTADVRINLFREVGESESLRGLLYTDDGDGLFSERDSVKRNPETGAPISIPLY